jgi:hypothetical protein
LPLTLSRSLRVEVARGNIEYSAVIQPSPESFLNRGTPGETEAVQSTRVLPTSIKHEPSGAEVQFTLKLTGRSWLALRPSVLVILPFSD